MVNYFDAGMPDPVKMTTQERAYNSPIWYTPEAVEPREGQMRNVAS